MRLHFQKGDCIAIGAVVRLAALVFVLFLPKPAQSAVVEIYHNGVLVQTMPLSQDGQYTLQGTYENVIAVSGGKVFRYTTPSLLFFATSSGMRMK